MAVQVGINMKSLTDNHLESNWGNKLEQREAPVMEYQWGMFLEKLRALHWKSHWYQNFEVRWVTLMEFKMVRLM